MTEYARANLSVQEETLAEFSSLGSAMLVWAMNCTHFVKQPNLKLKTRPRQLLVSLPLAFTLHVKCYTLSGLGLINIRPGWKC